MSRTCPIPCDCRACDKGVVVGLGADLRVQRVVVDDVVAVHRAGTRFDAGREITLADSERREILDEPGRVLEGEGVVHLQAVGRLGHPPLGQSPRDGLQDLVDHRASRRGDFGRLLARVGQGGTHVVLHDARPEHPEFERQQDIHGVQPTTGPAESRLFGGEEQFGARMIGFGQRLRKPRQVEKRGQFGRLPVRVHLPHQPQHGRTCRASSPPDTNPKTAIRRGATSSGGSPTGRNTAAASRRTGSLPARPNSVWRIQRSLPPPDRGPCPPLPGRRIRRADLAAFFRRSPHLETSRSRETAAFRRILPP